MIRRSKKRCKSGNLKARDSFNLAAKHFSIRLLLVHADQAKKDDTCIVGKNAARSMRVSPRVQTRMPKFSPRGWRWIESRT